MMRLFTAHVRNGRLVIELVRGDVHGGDLLDARLELVSADGGGDLLDAEERAELDRELEAPFDEEEAGELIDAANALADLRAQPSDQDDQ